MGGRRGTHKLRAKQVYTRHGELRTVGIQQATSAWATILQVVGGPAQKLLERLRAGGTCGHLGVMLRRWAHRTALRHAKNAMEFISWYEAQHGHWPRGEPLPRAEERLIEFLHFIIGQGVKATVPTAKLGSITFLNRIADLQPALPTTKLSVQAAAAAHQRDGRRRMRRSTVYTVHEVRLL